MTIFAAAVLLALAGMQSGPEKQSDFDPQAAAVTRADLLVQAGKIEEAVAVLDPALAAYERTYAGEKRKIICDMNPTETGLAVAAALVESREMVTVSPAWCSALFLKGYTLDDQRRFAEAAPFLERAAAMAPRHAHYFVELGYAYQQQHNWPASNAAYRHGDENAAHNAATLKEERGRAWRGLGYNLVEEGKLDEAEALYRKCLELDPNDVKSQGELRYIAEQRARRT
jgi:tetratricopeptide (TPR) repeat protein